MISIQGFAFGQTFVYRIADFFKNPIEYRNPFGIITFEIKAGGQLLGLNAIGFDSTETSLEGFNQLINRYIHNVEVELVKYNLLGLIVPQNFADFQTGLGFKYKSSIINQGLPETWPQYAPGANQNLYFAPLLIEGNINQSLAFQWSKRFYNYLQFNAGRAYISAYKTREGDRFLNQNGWTFSIAVGMKFLSKIEYNFKEAYGIELEYNIARFDNFMDTRDLSPIENLNFSSIGISLTFSMINGGNPTQGDVAKALYKQGDYIAAKANFEDFISKNPTHPRLFKARWMIDECNNLMAFQQVELAKHFVEVKNFSKASQYLQLAEKSRYESLAQDIDSSYQNIILWWRNSLDSLILSNSIDQAEQFLQATRQLKLPNTEELTKLYRSEIYFHRGVVFTDYKVWEKALHFFDLAIQHHPPIRERIEPYLSKIAYGYIADVNLSVEQQNIELALESLRQASEIRPEINFLTRGHIETLEQGIQYLKEQAANEKLKNAVDQTRRIPAESTFRPQIGMKSDRIKTEYGPPAFKKALQSSQNQEYELWIYNTADSRELLYYFKNGILSKIETPN
ncbi:MAG: hypothetical protein Q7J65_07890 [Candidatus Marinimicrobia bacterium]|nr:hypothetical protein [Candidatus Neomarinimicrobiota bacterium]